MQTHERPFAKRNKRGCTRSAPKFDLRTQLLQMYCVALTRIETPEITRAFGSKTSARTDSSTEASVEDRLRRAARVAATQPPRQWQPMIALPSLLDETFQSMVTASGFNRLRA